MPAAEDHRWMRQALRLALPSCGRTWPNPGVGCVLVRDGACIGRGRHRRDGGPHAEIEALRDAARGGHDPRGATAYVTLAPCTSRGRTGSCAQALLAAGVARVVAAVADPGQDGADAVFAAAGIAYTCGCEEDLGRALHGGFLSRVVSGRPRVTGKWAMTLDGLLAAWNGHSAWISSAEARALSRRRRRLYDAVLIGAGTALADDPELLALHPGRDPLRIVVSAAGELPDHGRLQRSIGRAPLWLVHGPEADPDHLLDVAARGVRCLPCIDPHDPDCLLRALGSAGINELLVEGGATVHGAFLRAGRYDRLECWLAARSLGGGMPVAAGVGVERIEQGASWQLEAAPRLLGDTLYLRYGRTGDRA